MDNTLSIGQLERNGRPALPAVIRHDDFFSSVVANSDNIRSRETWSLRHPPNSDKLSLPTIVTSFESRLRLFAT